MHFFEIFLPKNLVMSKKSSTFAPAFEKKTLLNGVMVALQILVLSVWVRVLVEQQKKVSSWGLSCFSYRLKPRFLALKGTINQ